MRKQKKQRNALKIFIFIVIILLLAIGGYALYFYNHAKKTVNDRMHNPVETINTSLTKKKIKATEPINVLLLGIDALENQRGSSDAIMIMQLQHNGDAMTIGNIQRAA